MRFRTFENQITPMPIFNLNDIRKIDVTFKRQQLNYWLKQKYINKLTAGYYFLPGQTINESILYFTANHIYEPSYISLETALAYYQIIPELVFGVTSISTRKTKTFHSEWGRFAYRSISNRLMFGYQIIVISPNVKFKIAKLEKVILDYLYLNSHIQSSDDFSGLRWNRTLLMAMQENSTFHEYQTAFNNQSLNKRILKLWEYINA